MPWCTSRWQDAHPADDVPGPSNRKSRWQRSQLKSAWLPRILKDVSRSWSNCESDLVGVHRSTVWQSVHSSPGETAPCGWPSPDCAEAERGTKGATKTRTPKMHPRTGPALRRLRTRGQARRGKGGCFGWRSCIAGALRENRGDESLAGCDPAVHRNRPGARIFIGTRPDDAPGARQGSNFRSM